MSIKIALAGNPNSGKTTLFNNLTGSNQFVGNWPGVTVEKKEGKLKGYKDSTIMDLPGIYSLSPYTLEEVVSRDYLLSERPDAIINIIDGTNIERNLYLTTQLLELGIPVIIAINMMDLVNKNGDIIDIKKLSDELGCEIVSISAINGTGAAEIAEKAVNLAKEKLTFISKHQFGEEIERALAQIESQIGSEIPVEQKRFFAIKLFERDIKINEKIDTIINLEDIIGPVEENLDDDSESIIISERYNFISSLINTCYTKKSHGKMTTSDKIDRIVTNRFLALPIFALIMFIIYYVSVTTVGAMATDWANDGVFGDGWNFFGLSIPGVPVIIEGILNNLGTADWLNSLILDGVVGGVGAILGFVPQMLILFLFLSFIEACGYMSRIAFIMDRIFRRFGLSGKSFISMIIGTGCGVPGIMASRTIENDRDRKMTIMTTTFIPCGAKLPIIALFAGALFNGAWWVAPSAYFMGIAAVVVSGIILKKSRAFAGEPAPFVMELPSYHMPTVTNVLRSMWERGWSFIKKAGTIIFLSSVILWFLMNFGMIDGRITMVEDLNDGFLSNLGNSIAWIFIPLGWGNWQATVATITGLIAKENVVGTFGVLFGFAEIAEDGAEIWGTMAASFSSVSAYSFLVFNLLCAPCFAAIGAIKREMNNAKWTWFAIGYQTVFAYSIALCIYQFGNFFTTGAFGVGTVFALSILVIFVFLLFRSPSKNKAVRR
jgi:ferrous iron transport protein B